jgi:hypothetical protein
MLRKSSFVLLGLSVAFVVSAMLSITAEAGTVLSKGTVSFNTSFFDSVTNETVKVSGTLHFITQATNTSTADTLNLYPVLPAKFVAVGQTTGIHYKVPKINLTMHPRPHLTLTLVQ